MSRDFTDALRKSPDTELARLFNEHRQTLTKIVMMRFDVRLRARVDPSDIIQETMFEAFRRLDEYLRTPSIPFLKWLILLADQQARLARRKHVHTQMRTTNRETDMDEPLETALASDSTDPGIRVLNHERKQQLLSAISQLNSRDQEIVEKRFLQGQSLAQIASELGLTVDAVSKRAMRSLSRLISITRDLGLNDSSSDFTNREYHHQQE